MLDEKDGPLISVREAIVAENHAAITGKCTNCLEDHTPAQHKAHGVGSYRRQHPGRFRRWNVTHTIAGGRAEDVSQVGGANEEAARAIAEARLPKGSKILKIKYAGTVDGVAIPEAGPMKSRYALVEVGTRKIAEGKNKGKVVGIPKAKRDKKAAVAKSKAKAGKVAAPKPAKGKSASTAKKPAKVAKASDAPKLTPAVEKKIRDAAIAEERKRCNDAKRKRAKKASPAPTDISKKKPVAVSAATIKKIAETAAKQAVKAEEKVIAKEVANAVRKAPAGRRKGDMSDKAGGESGGLMGSGAVLGARKPGPKPKTDRDAAKAARGERARFSPADIKDLAAELAAATKKPAKKAPAAKKAAPKPKPNGKGKAKEKKAAKKAAIPPPPKAKK